MYGDPERLFALANAVEAKETELRRRVVELRRVAAGTQWQSAAARKHRERLEHDLAAVLRCADRLSTAGDELRAHATVVAERIAMIAAAEREVRQWFAAAAGSLARRVDDVLDELGDLADAITPWDGWRWRPESLPVPGHVDWLDAARLVGSSPWQP